MLKQLSQNGYKRKAAREKAGWAGEVGPRRAGRAVRCGRKRREMKRKKRRNKKRRKLRGWRGPSMHLSTSPCIVWLAGAIGCTGAGRSPPDRMRI